VVCISHATGAGGGDVARLVAERLGFTYADDEIVARAAAEGRLDPADVASEERRRTLVARILEAMAQGSEAWALARSGSTGAVEGPGPEEIRALIRDAIADVASRGNVVLVAHGASFVLSRQPNALRVLVTASPEIRASRLAGLKGLDDGRAAHEVKEADAARRDYLRRFYDIDAELPIHYDLVVNTDIVSVERAAAVIAQAAASES
jgi:cytidylate kinase